MKHDDVSKGNKVLESLISGSLSSVITTTLFQPLELLKTNIQLRQNQDISSKIFGRSTKSASILIQNHGLAYIWRGTGASLLRSVPGVGLYYASLNVLQTNFSEQSHQPDNSAQAFYFGLIARSMVSFILSPITVVKVRYESGRYKYPSLSGAIRDAYFKNGWVGVLPTIFRDSLFSGIYYMCYTKLKIYNNYSTNQSSDSLLASKNQYVTNFSNGLMSGLIASLITNPLDVLKTNIQVETMVEKNNNRKSLIETTIQLAKGDQGYLRFFDGLALRCLRRTLIASSTWTFYEFFMNMNAI